VGCDKASDKLQSTVASNHWQSIQDKARDTRGQEHVEYVC